MGKTAVVLISVAAVAAGVAAAVVVRRRMKREGKWGKAMAILKDLEEKCGTPTSKLKQVADALTVEMHAGLASEGGSKLKMLVSFVDNLPTGYISLSFCCLYIFFNLDRAFKPFDIMCKSILAHVWFYVFRMRLI